MGYRTGHSPRYVVRNSKLSLVPLNAVRRRCLTTMERPIRPSSFRLPVRRFSRSQGSLGKPDANSYDFWERQYSTTKRAELTKMIVMLTFTSTLLLLAMTPPASNAIAEAISRTCALVMSKNPFWEISIGSTDEWGIAHLTLVNPSLGAGSNSLICLFASEERVSTGQLNDSLQGNKMLA